MKKHRCYLLAITAFFFFCQPVFAQPDSLLDLGRIKVKKEQLQTVTIKGSDLQKIPFGTISEVIAPWLHGAMNSRANLVFVIDGNLVNDVNAVSIYDIEEITLVQNAMVQVNGAINQQQLVLVKTKRNTQDGIRVAGSSALANTDTDGNDKSETNLYHQYYLSAHKNFDKISVGASANWVRDVTPLIKAAYVQSNTPHQLNRFRFNGWFDFRMAAGHTISAGLLYVPQSVKHDYSSGNTFGLRSETSHEKQSLFNPYIKFSNRIGGGFTNELSISYLHADLPATMSASTSMVSPGGPVQTAYINREQENKLTNLLIREQISYQKQIGDWLLQPAVNFTYRYVTQKFEYRMVTGDNNNPPSLLMSTAKFKSKAYILTPSAGISYKNSFHLAGGVAATLTDDGKPLGDGVFPFASVMLDVFRIGNAGNAESLKIFGSYAKAANFNDMYFSQQSVSLEAHPTTVPSPLPFFGPGITVVNPFPEDAVRNNLQLGADFTTPGHELQISYQFSDRKYVDVLAYQLPGPAGTQWVVSWPDYCFTHHRLGIMAKLAEEGKFQWRTGFNVTTFKLTMKLNDGIFTNFETVSNYDKPNWTGGFTNRLSMGRFSAGIDLLYYFNERRPYLATSNQKFNTWRLNTLYLAYSGHVVRRPAEIFVVTRNMLRDDDAIFAGPNTRYYGAGFTIRM